MQLLSLLCSATMDEGKREINIISSVGYFLCIYEFFFLLSAHVLLFFIYSILLSIYERRGEVRSKIVLYMTTEVQGSDLWSSYDTN